MEFCILNDSFNENIQDLGCYDIMAIRFLCDTEPSCTAATAVAIFIKNDEFCVNINLNLMNFPLKPMNFAFTMMI